LLFILADQWRGQALPWTDRDLIAPNLARLAEGGVEFNRAYTLLSRRLAGASGDAHRPLSAHLPRDEERCPNCLKTK